MWGTGYTVVESSHRSEVVTPSLSHLRISRDELKKKIEKEEMELNSYEANVIQMQEDLKEWKEDLESLKIELFEIDNKINDVEVREASDMIKKLRELGFDVYKKDRVELVYIHFPEEEKIFGIKGKMIYNNEAIDGKFNKHNFDQLYGKKLKLIDIPEEEIDAHTKMNHWIKRSLERMGDTYPEKKVEVVFSSASGAEILSKSVFIQIERMNKQYKTEDLKPYVDVYFTIREILPHEV